MKLELKITESQALLEIHAVSDFELETLQRMKKCFDTMIPSLEVEEREYYDRERPPKSAVISIDFLNEPLVPSGAAGVQGDNPHATPHQ